MKYLYADGIDRRTGTEARFAKSNTTTGAQTNNYFDFRNSYVWDKLNRVDIVTQRSANDPLAITWTANATTTRTVDLNYFADSTLQSISRAQGSTGATTAPMVTTFTTVADGTKNEGRIASITHSGLTGGSVVYSYGYDDHGRISSFTSPAGTRTYQYDSFDQVIGASGAAQTAESYNYDTNGNRTSAAIVTGQYNRITSDGTYSYQYDKEGNRTRRTLTGTGEYEVYVWDYRQRLVSVTKRSAVNAVLQTVTYEYDGLDRRIRRTVANSAGTVTTQQRFLYDTNVLSSLLPLGGEGARRADEGAVWEVVIVLDERLAGESYQKVDHRYMNGPAIDQVFADETGGNGVLWYLSDTQNTVRDVAKFASTSTGSLATVRNHLEYNTFGNVTSADDPTTATVNDGDRPGLEGTGNEFSPQRSYTGREPDPATGLIYYRARWFDPRTGRFISEDPIGFAAGDANLNRYVGNSTPNGVDPSGLDFVDVDGSMAIWVEEGSFGRNGQSHDLGIIEGDVIHLRPSLGGGTVPLSRLQTFVNAGLKNDSLAFGVSSLTGLGDAERDVYLRFAINEVFFRNNGTLRAGDRGDEDGNVTYYAGAGGPVAAALVTQMVRQVAVELGVEFAGGTALSAVAKGGKLFVRAGLETFELTAEKIAKKLGKKVDDVNLNAIAKELDGKTPDVSVAPISGIADAAAIRGIRAAGVFNHTAKSLDDALASIRKAMPDTVELPRAIAGRPYPSPPPGVKKWFQIHPPEPGVGNNLPHIKFVDWTNGKKGTGGSWGHIFFPE